MPRPKEISLKFGIPGWFEIGSTWEPQQAERLAAWELYVELVTRIAVIPLQPGEGLLREALASLYALFSITRDILRRNGPAVAPRRTGRLTVGYLSVGVLNGLLRPLLARWHPKLLEYEAEREASVSATEHERRWEHEAELRAELEKTRRTLVQYALALGDAAGAGPLLPTDWENQQRA